MHCCALCPHNENTCACLAALPARAYLPVVTDIGGAPTPVGDAALDALYRLLARRTAARKTVAHRALPLIHRVW
ncbi:hypothetical protein SAMN05216466_11960 [Paraburkholderia phenazinium]|jgi:hypothetical protein|uniref:Uncharacterized protein n=1 Tax=Paraburkholderia phenazinium TaxID=60549 RepID=A0A1G8IXQ2_9BURK|nr:hypothetical protein SAMN05216466_11960 [Paraburkholderia phenazinium]